MLPHSLLKLAPYPCHEPIAMVIAPGGCDVRTLGRRCAATAPPLLCGSALSRGPGLFQALGDEVRRSTGEKDTHMTLHGSATRRVPIRHLMIACAVALLMLVTACNRGSNDSGNKASSTDMDKRRAYAQCMRDNGLSNFPDPNPNGESGAGHEQVSRDDPQFKAASEKCQKDLPQHGGG